MSTSTNISLSRFQQLVAKARALAKANSGPEKELDHLTNSISQEQPHEVNLSNLNITPESLKTKEGIEQAVETITEVVSRDSGENSSESFSERNVSDGSDSAGDSKEIMEVGLLASPSKIRHTTRGVAADVSLNEKQQLFITTALESEDICLIGAAGTGKTTVVGKFIRSLLDSGDLEDLGKETKYLRSSVPGVLITSFTRKAVNNIRRAVPELLKPHTLTMHKVLEFEPVFYDMEDPKDPSRLKRMLKFEPKRNALNPLPSSLSLVVYEESSMIGTDLYNMMSAAMPHNPQEIFIGDIRQLPPIFGPAILGFKMSLLPVVELTEVYRQALLSPIIRLAHSILSGDSSKFSTRGSFTVDEIRTDPETGKERKIPVLHVPNLEAYNEESEHGTVKFQIFQKRLSVLHAGSALWRQFQVWDRTGYYNPKEDVILTPFNINEVGTIELNKHISNFLGRKRGATVHEVIAREQKHYLAIGDRVLYDKEDAIVTDIRRNLTYVGKSPMEASIHLDRWGVMQEQLTEVERRRIAEQGDEFSDEAMDRFMNSYSDGDEDSTNAGSHVVDIQYSYSDERETLSKSGELNNLLGGYCLTVHKMQGSEADNIFLVLHHSNAGPLLTNELIYTSVTRAAKRLHIICETDSFYKAVKSHKVRGVTLADKIEYFRGKVGMVQMQEEMEFVKKQREEKKRKLEEQKKRWERNQDVIFSNPVYTYNDEYQEYQEEDEHQKSVYEQKWEIAKEVLDEIEEERVQEEEFEKFAAELTDPTSYYPPGYSKEKYMIDYTLLTPEILHTSELFDTNETLELPAETAPKPETPTQPLETIKPITQAEKFRLLKQKLAANKTS